MDLRCRVAQLPGEHGDRTRPIRHILEFGSSRAAWVAKGSTDHRVYFISFQQSPNIAVSIPKDFQAKARPLPSHLRISGSGVLCGGKIVAEPDAGTFLAELSPLTVEACRGSNPEIFHFRVDPSEINGLPDSTPVRSHQERPDTKRKDSIVGISRSAPARQWPHSRPGQLRWIRAAPF